MTDNQELHRPIVTDELPARGRTMNIVAADVELMAIAKRLVLIALRSLDRSVAL